jgi:hypothetical protein
MQDLLQDIDFDYYRSARLLIVRAEIAQLRQQSAALARTERQCKTPPIGNRDQPESDGRHVPGS